jgi:hypothetical protein
VTRYADSDIWRRLVTWKFPLWQLIFLFPRPPLGFGSEAFVLVHLFGDPIGTIASILYTLHRSQLRAQQLMRKYPPNDTLWNQPDREWKTLAIIMASYEESGYEKIGDRTRAENIQMKLSVIILSLDCRITSCADSTVKK